MSILFSAIFEFASNIILLEKPVAPGRKLRYNNLEHRHSIHPTRLHQCQKAQPPAGKQVLCGGLGL
jgi:hypothetical protein